LKDLGIVVVNYHTDDLLVRFLKSLEKYKPSCSIDIVVQDVEKEVDFPISSHYYTYNRYEENIGYAKACNLGALDLDVRYLGFFNADTEFVDSDCLDVCVDYLDSHEDVGAVGPLQVDSHNRVTHAGITGTHSAPKHRGWKSHNPDRYRDRIECITISGSAFLTPAKVWREMMECSVYKDAFPDATGALLPTPLYYEETGYMYHLFSHDYKVMYLGDAKMIHEWHSSSPVGSQVKKMKTSQGIFRDFCDKHGIEHD
jgi:GT2 family glycosyltransferase